MKSEKQTESILLDGVCLDKIARVSADMTKGAAEAIRKLAENVRAENEARAEVEAARAEVVRVVSEGERLAATIADDAAAINADMAKLQAARDAANDKACELLGIAKDDWRKSLVKRYVSGEVVFGDPIEFYAFGEQVFNPSVTPEMAKAFRVFRYALPNVPGGEVCAHDFIKAAVRYKKAVECLNVAADYVRKSIDNAARVCDELDAARKRERATVEEALSMQRARDVERRNAAAKLKAQAEALLAFSQT